MCVPFGLCVFGCRIIQCRQRAKFSKSNVYGACSEIHWDIYSPRVLLCYRKVLPCYRGCVTGNSQRIVCIGMLFALAIGCLPYLHSRRMDCSRLDKPRVRALTARVRAR